MLVCYFTASDPETLATVSIFGKLVEKKSSLGGHDTSRVHIQELNSSRSKRTNWNQSTTPTIDTKTRSIGKSRQYNISMQAGEQYKRLFRFDTLREMTHVT